MIQYGNLVTKGQQQQKRKKKQKKKKKIKNLVGKWSHKNPLKRHQIHTNYSFSFQNFNKNDLFENSSTN